MINVNKLRFQWVARTYSRTLALVIVTGMALVGGGCASDGSSNGYSATEIYDSDIRTVSVDILANRSFYREVEFQLTEAIIKQIEQRTPYKVTQKAGADTIITGTILDVDQRLLSRTFDGGITQEAQIVVTASIEWKDLRTGKVLRKRSRIQGTGEYVPTRPVGEPSAVAIHAAVDELSRDVVSVMQSDW